MSDSDSISSTSSDEEYLTQGNVDREALVRKKLLESFYGKATLGSPKRHPNAASSDSDNHPDDDNDESKELNPEDLDSPDFDARLHTRQHVGNTSVQELLETEERLALQVRTLDSTMQTLVYENYSRFIEATNAIRSIGINVTANEGSLDKLRNSMERIDENCLNLEGELGSLRTDVAEKIRIQRLLTRLDALLKLPKTLNELIQAKKYRTATKSYLQASSILRQHSSGFESLQKIETECNEILMKMKNDITIKLRAWSGHLEGIEPPTQMADIFECAGTLLMLVDPNDPTENEDAIGLDTIRTMTITACGRSLDRILDTHLIAVDERRFSDFTDDELPGESMLIPRAFLDGILEIATLYSLTFSVSDVQHLTDFVDQAFDSFLAHVRSLLLDESATIKDKDESRDEPGGQKELSEALNALIQAVRELASGITLPEVGINVEFASNLVEKASDLADSMVQRRVYQKFYELRVDIVQNCLIPFASRIVEEYNSKEVSRETILAEALHLGSSTLSDCMQLVDDAIRSVVADHAAESSSSTDIPVLREAVQVCITRFGFWLASSFEILSGDEISNDKNLIDALRANGDLEQDEQEKLETPNSSAVISGEREDVDNDDREESLLDLLHLASKMLRSLEQDKEKILSTDYILVIAEICRLAEQSVMENLEQSISNHFGKKKKSKGLFPAEISITPSKNAKSLDKVSHRFLLARSRALVIYGTTHGTEMANLLCLGIGRAGQTGVIPDQPRSDIMRALEIAKNAAISCSTLFGDTKRAGPLPKFNEDTVYPFSSRLINRKSGLQLDVERMFKEVVQIFPHPSEPFDASRNSVLFLIFKVAFRALVEQCRLDTFSYPAVRQMFVDIEFLKFILPHYISHEYPSAGSDALTSLATLLSDILETIEERCTDEVSTEIEVLAEASKEIVRDFTSKIDSAEAGAYDFILTED